MEIKLDRRALVSALGVAWVIAPGQSNRTSLAAALVADAAGGIGRAPQAFPAGCVGAALQQTQWTKPRGSKSRLSSYRRGSTPCNNGAQVIHLATGLVAGYPPCPRIHTFKTFLETRYGVQVVVGTHPIPTKYLELHTRLGTWEAPAWEPLLALIMADKETRDAYN